MHVLLLNQPFHPDVVATAQHLWDLARHLSDHGHRVSVICSRNFYGTNRRHAQFFERIGKIETHRVGGTALGKKNLLARLLDFISFYIAAAWKMHHIAAPDVIVALTTPPMISLLAVLYKQFHQTRTGKRVRFVYYVMDLYPDVAAASGHLKLRSILYWLLHQLTNRTIQAADAVIALGRDMRDVLIERYSHARPSKIEIIQPWSDSNELAPAPKTDETFNIVYSGNLGIAHDLDTLITAIQAMENDAQTRWIFIGAGKRMDALQERARSAKWSHVTFLPYQQREALAQSLNLADVHLVSQAPAFTGLVVPSKLLGIMAVAKPAVMVGPAEAECSRIIQEHAIGYVIPNGRAYELVDRLRALRENPKLRDEMGRRGREVMQQLYDRQVACHKIENLLKRVVS